MKQEIMKSVKWNLILPIQDGSPMAMPRPSGRAQEIAEMVIPGLSSKNSSKKKRRQKKGELSEVEIMQTNNIDKGKL